MTTYLPILISFISLLISAAALGYNKRQTKALEKQLHLQLESFKRDSLPELINTPNNPYLKKLDTLSDDLEFIGNCIKTLKG